LLLYTDFLDLLNILGGRTVENGKLGTADLNQAIVNAKRIKSRQTMFNSGDSHVAFA